MAKVKKEVKEIPTQLCTCCGNTKKVNGTYFYKSYSVLFRNNFENRMIVCKDCVVKLADEFRITFNSEVRGIYELCKLLDTYYEGQLFESAKAQAESKNSNPYQIYFQKCLSLPQYRDKTFIDSEVFDKKKDDDKVAEDIGRDLIEFWGRGYSQEDYDFLNREFDNMLSRYECDSYAQEVLFQEICFQRLDIKKKRSNGSSVDKEIKTLQDLLGSANIKPAQENASMASEQVTFGTLIKKFENEEPIPEPLESWTSEDWIKKYVVVWFFGNLCKMMGKVNPFVSECDEEVAKYTVNLYEDEGDE